jgi:peptidyl-prolyl cis-trans isomerase SurA
LRNLLSFLFLCFFVSNFFGQKTVDKIVAQVGDNIILLSDIEGQKAMMRQNKITPTQQDACAMLENLMYQYLLVNQAEIDSVQISDEQVDAEMENRLRMIEMQMKDAKDEKGNPMSIEKFYGKSKAAIKDEFRDIIKKRGITAKVEVSPREVELFFNSIPKDSLPYINSQLIFQQIAIFPTVTKADKERAKTELEEIRTQIISKKITFERAAKANSDDPGSAQEGGKIEATRGMMVKPFEAMAYTLKPGDISEVFETEYGFHIMKMIERKGDDYVVQHILKSIKFSMDSLDASDKRMAKCYEDLRANKITWENAVKVYSNDKNTKESKGTITNPITGEQSWSIEDINQVDPQMFQLTDALGKNEVSTPSLYFDIFERKEGLRIVRLAERTLPHVANLKEDYDLFRKLAEEDKRNKAIKAWTKTKISGAYIRISEDFQTCKFENEWIAKP